MTLPVDQRETAETAYVIVIIVSFLSASCGWLIIVITTCFFFCTACYYGLLPCFRVVPVTDTDYKS